MPETDFGIPSSPDQMAAFEEYEDMLRDLQGRVVARAVPYVEALAYAVEFSAARDTSDIRANLEASEQMDEAVGLIRDQCKASGTPIFQ